MRLSRRLSWGSFFTFRRPQSAELGRVGVIVGDEFGLVKPSAFGLSAALGEDEFLLACAYACIGEHLDRQEIPPPTPSGANATELLCEPDQLRAWADGKGLADDAILSYLQGKVYWSWKFEFIGASIDASDCLRLHSRIKTLRRVAEVGAGHWWKIDADTANGFLLRPLPSFVREQHEARNAREVGSSISILLAAPRYAGPAEHWRKAQEYSRAETRDLANAAKEAVSAVEGLACILINDHKASLGEAIKQLRVSRKLDPALAKSLEAVWGFTSNSPGVRHGAATPSKITLVEARWVMDSCEALIRLLLPLDG